MVGFLFCKALQQLCWRAFFVCGRGRINKIPVVSIFGCYEGQEVEDEFIWENNMRWIFARDRGDI
jgi:hypothetical protein